MILDAGVEKHFRLRRCVCSTCLVEDWCLNLPSQAISNDNLSFSYITFEFSGLVGQLVTKMPS